MCTGATFQFSPRPFGLKTNEPPGNAFALTSPGGRCGGMLVSLPRAYGPQIPSYTSKTATRATEARTQPAEGLQERCQAASRNPCGTLDSFHCKMPWTRLAIRM